MSRDRHRRPWQDRNRHGRGGHQQQRAGVAPHRGSRPPPEGPPRQVAGTFEITEHGDGHLRDPKKNYSVHSTDPIVPRDIAQQSRLRGGEDIVGQARGHGSNLQLVSIEQINGRSPADYAALTPFDDLTVIDPREVMRFETAGGPLTMRIVDMFSPIGKGQRGLLVAPPRTGKTVLLTQMASAIRRNYPEVALMMLLIDERPEEVTEMKRTIGAAAPDGSTPADVVFSTNDKDVLSHVHLARLMIAKAKRRLECGMQVCILLDSLTRLGRAFNAYVGSSGRTMTGGIDIRALMEPKAMFGAARNIEHGGSLTIIASILVETGSRMDDFIFQEFKGTGNMELVLNRDLANLRIWPAMDIAQSGTRKEELLLDAASLPKIHRIRRKLMNMPMQAQMQTALDELGKHPSNAAFLATLPA